MTTWVGAPGAGTDDADQNQSSGSYNRNNTTLRGHSDLVTSPGNRWNFGVRMPQPPMLKNDVIDLAQVSVVANAAATDNPDGVFYMQDAGNCNAFPAAAGTDDVNTRTRTSQSAAWTAVDVGFTPTRVTCPNALTAAVQHVVDRSDYVSGASGAVCVIWVANTTLTPQQFAPRSRDHASGATEAVNLTVDYHTPQSLVVPNRHLALAHLLGR